MLSDARILCAQTDPEVFHPEKGQSNVYAKRICGRCEVRGACLDAALAMEPQPHGVWGGLSETERKAIIRRRKAKAAA